MNHRTPLLPAAAAVPSPLQPTAAAAESMPTSLRKTARSSAAKGKGLLRRGGKCHRESMEWQVRPIARQCAASGKELRPGDIVTCIVHKPLGGVIERADVLKEHAAAFNPPAGTLDP